MAEPGGFTVSAGLLNLSATDNLMISTGSEIRCRLETFQQLSKNAEQVGYPVAMKTLPISEISEVGQAPVGWEEASENGWGYLTLIALQESGYLSKIVRIRRVAPHSEYRDVIDEALQSYVEDTHGVSYAKNFLELQWHFQPQQNSKNFWAELSTEVYARINSKAPSAEENYQGILAAVAVLYGPNTEGAYPTPSR